jgi:hypothetical protein
MKLSFSAAQTRRKRIVDVEGLVDGVLAKLAAVF